MVSFIFFLISILNEELSSLFDQINKEKLETYITLYNMVFLLR